MLQSLRLWVYAARPKTLFIGSAPILFGSLLAIKHSQFHLPTFFLCLIGALSIQIGTNYCNDYFDYINKADTFSRKGNKKVLEQGCVSPKTMKKAFLFSFLVSGFTTVFLLPRGGLVLLFIASMCIFFSIAYTAPPFPLAYLGLGDVFVLVFYGPITTLTCFYLHSHSFFLENILLSLIPGVLGLGPLIMNNLRDLEQDRQVDKKTLIVRFGDSFGKYYFLITLLIGSTIPYIHSFFFEKNPFIFLTTLSYIPVIKKLPVLFNYKDRNELQNLFIASAKTVPLYTIFYLISEGIFYVTRSLFV